MPDRSILGFRRILDPAERLAEVLFGLIMVLTLTDSLSVAKAGRADVRTMLIAALGCNLAWGIIDAVLYLMGRLAETARSFTLLQAVRAATDSRHAHHLISGALPDVVASIIEPAELEVIAQRMRRLPEPTEYARLSGTDWMGAAGVFLLVFLSTFPVAVPFILLSNVALAKRASNAVAVAMLLVVGVAYGRHVGRSAWGFGVTIVALGGSLVALTIALGG